MDSLKSKTCCDVVLFRFDGEEIKTDETIRTLAQKWQSSRRPRSEERNTKAVDTDMIVVSCMVGCSKNALKHQFLSQQCYKSLFEMIMFLIGLAV